MIQKYLSFPVFLCAFFNPLQHSIRYCNATKQPANQQLARSQKL